MGWRNVFFAAALTGSAALLSASQPAQATVNGWMMCWVPGLGSSHECVKLPSNWSITGVRKARCNPSDDQCNSAMQSFRINRRNLRSVARYAPVDGTDLGSTVTIYSDRY